MHGLQQGFDLLILECFEPGNKCVDQYRVLQGGIQVQCVDWNNDFVHDALLLLIRNEQLMWEKGKSADRHN